jgi:pyruvate dehydrogenase E2 component (dihydrolipoamide acetyltransferase)
MAETVTMPKLGFDMAEGVLVRWVKRVGDAINKGDVIAEIETDKATVEVECPYSGVVLKHLVEQSTSVPVGNPIAIVGAAGEQVADQAAAKPKEQALPAGWPTKPAESTRVESIAASVLPVSGVIFASPLARKVARDHQVDLSRVRGSGPNGRVVRRDVEAALAGGTTLTAPAVPVPVQSTPVTLQRDDEHIPLNKLRSAIGRRMVESKTTIPHFQVTHQIRADQLMETRAKFNALVGEDEKLSVNDFIVKAAALALRVFPNLNASLTSTELIRHGHIHIGVAVSVEGGLLTIVVKDADRKSMREISAEVKEMAARTRLGKVKPEDIEGSTFSISNLGMYDVEAFTAIINPPEAGILAVGSVHDAPVVEDGQIKVGKILNATISADHRVTDGVEAARFMQELARLIENPLLMVM